MPPPGRALTLHETARRLAAYAWAESRAFEVLGSWVQTVPEPEVKACLATHSRAHGWHAEVWTAAMPRPHDLPDADFVAPLSGAAASFFDALGAVEGTAERLAGAFRVLVPRLVSAYRAHLAVAAPAGDGATTRWLRIVLDDETNQWREGEALLQALLDDAGAVRRAVAAQADLEAALVAAGGLFAP